MDFEILKPLLKSKVKSKIVLLVMDGLGGLPLTPDGKTELETAKTPNLDAIATKSILGLQQPLLPGMTPGSGPAHLGLFGYDPLKYKVGRGVLSALGIDFDLQANDIAARGNFCTVDNDGLITDRRAGRIPTKTCVELCKLLSDNINIPNVEVFLKPVKEYRFLLVIRAGGLKADITETDPQSVGYKPLLAQAITTGSQKTAEITQEFISQASVILKNQHPANMLLLRGFSQLPTWPKFSEAFGLKAIAIAMYPMYRGVAKLVGMNALPAAHSMEEEIDMLEANWEDNDFFFVHIKKTDSAGEDGNFDLKVSIIEKVDSLMPRIMALKPDVLIVTGDHSTPAKMKSHSWHPVPTMIYSDLCRPDCIAEFGERTCRAGGLGPRFPAYELMPMALAHANRIEKFGA